MKLEELMQSIVDYEKAACEEFWDDNPQLCPKMNQTDFAVWLKDNYRDEYDLVLEALVKYRKDGGKNICTIGLSNTIEPIEEKFLAKKIDLCSIFFELDTEMDASTLAKYLARYDCLSTIVYDLKEELRWRFVPILFCKFLVETNDPLLKEIAEIKYGARTTASKTVTVEDLFDELRFGLNIGDQETVEYAIEELDKCTLSFSQQMQLNGYRTIYIKAIEEFEIETKRFVDATRKYPDMDVYDIPDISDFIKKADAERLGAYINNAMLKGY